MPLDEPWIQKWACKWKVGVENNLENYHVPVGHPGYDRLIDNEYRMVDVCGQPEYVSDILYAMDPTRYQEIALELRETRVVPPSGSDQPADES